MAGDNPVFYSPTTAITNYMMGCIGLYLGWQTLQIQGSLFHILWACSFFSLSLGAFFWGSHYVFGPRLQNYITKVIWMLTLIFFGTTGLFLACSAATFYINETGKFGLMLGSAILVIKYVLGLNKNDTFHHAIKFYVTLIILALIGFIPAFFSLGYTGALQIVIGLLVNLSAAGVQASGLTLHKHFNHNDLFYVIQVLGMILIYRGGSEISMV